MIKYTDKHIKFYSEIWAVKRTNKKQYIIKESLMQSAMLAIASVPVILRSADMGFVSVLTTIMLTAGMGYLWARLSFWTAEKNYRKFLTYQASKQTPTSNPGEFYN